MLQVGHDRFLGGGQMQTWPQRQFASSTAQIALDTMSRMTCPLVKGHVPVSKNTTTTTTTTTITTTTTTITTTTTTTITTTTTTTNTTTTTTTTSNHNNDDNRGPHRRPVGEQTLRGSLLSPDWGGGRAERQEILTTRKCTESRLLTPLSRSMPLPY